MEKHWKFSKQVFWATMISAGVFCFISITTTNGSGYFLTEASTFKGFLIIFFYILLTIITATY